MLWAGWKRNNITAQFNKTKAPLVREWNINSKVKNIFRSRISKIRRKIHISETATKANWPWVSMLPNCHEWKRGDCFRLWLLCNIVIKPIFGICKKPDYSKRYAGWDCVVSLQNSSKFLSDPGLSTTCSYNYSIWNSWRILQNKKNLLWVINCVILRL